MENGRRYPGIISKWIIAGSDSSAQQISDAETKRILVRVFPGLSPQILAHIHSVPSDEKQFEAYEAGYVSTLFLK